MTERELFFRHIAQTSPEPIALEIVRAEGCKLYDAAGKEYIDLISGISVANVGHRHSKVIEAIRNQLDAYLHLMVYGEFVETPQVQFARFLVEHLPPSLNTVYFTNSGAEAVEGAMKLAKRYTRRTNMIGFNNSYHGSTQGALSLIGDERWRNAFRPLLPGVSHIRYNNFEDLAQISEDTACVLAETVQAEAGIIVPDAKWLLDLRNRCTEMGALLILDEIQAGFGRTGKLWGFEHFNIVPDILLLGKALGGGMPMGAFIADKSIMQVLTNDPALGHMTTFGGHPVCCAAGLAAMKVLVEENLLSEIYKKEELFKSRLKHPYIKAIRSFGLWLGVEFDSEDRATGVIKYCLKEGIFTDWFLFNSSAIRISPPLTISNDEIIKACSILSKAVQE